MKSLNSPNIPEVSKKIQREILSAIAIGVSLAGVFILVVVEVIKSVIE